MSIVLANWTRNKSFHLLLKGIILLFLTQYKCTIDIWSTKSKWISLSTNWSICCITIASVLELVGGECLLGLGLHFLNSLNFWPPSWKTFTPAASVPVMQMLGTVLVYSSRAASDEQWWSSEESALRQISCLMAQKITLYNRLTFDYHQRDKRVPSYNHGLRLLGK